MNNKKLSVISQYERVRKVAEGLSTREPRKLGFRRPREDSPLGSADHPYPRTREGVMWKAGKDEMTHLTTGI